MDDLAVNERASLKGKGRRGKKWIGRREQKRERERQREREREKRRRRGFHSDRMEEWEASPNTVSADQVDTGIVLLV